VPARRATAKILPAARRIPFSLQRIDVESMYDSRRKSAALSTQLIFFIAMQKFN
jgi:hypothetical protein